MALAVKFLGQIFLCCVGLLLHTRAAPSDQGQLFLAPGEGISERDPADLLQALEQLDRDSYGIFLEKRADRLEEAMRHIFKLAPKDARGRVDAEAARYTLHRIFVERHGWYVVGVERHTATRNTTRIEEALNNGSRFSLRQLARFGATVETLIHAENAKRLDAVFRAHNVSRDAPRDDTRAAYLLESYMALMLMTYRSPDNPPGALVARAMAERSRLYPSWSETKLFIKEVRKRVFEDTYPSFSLWESCLTVIDEISERYGRWQNKGCTELKDNLLRLEMPGTGRVPLKNFWGSAINGTHRNFIESVPFLEQLGALDAAKESILMTNYLYSQTNCMASSNYFDVCCIDECVALYSELEAQVDISALPPQHLADIVARIPSSTVSAPRQLSAALTQRLEEVSSHHGGVVPLYGRLFAQFMHHAFPHECPYPSLSDVNASKNPQKLIHHNDDEAFFNETFAKSFVEAASDLSLSPGDLPWTMEEELFLGSLQLEAPGSRFWGADASTTLQSVGFFLAFSGLAVALRSGLVKACIASSSSSSDKIKNCYV